jgi:hypothetical protein
MFIRVYIMIFYCYNIIINNIIKENKMSNTIVEVKKVHCKYCFYCTSLENSKRDDVSFNNKLEYNCDFCENIEHFGDSAYEPIFTYKNTIDVLNKNNECKNFLKKSEAAILKEKTRK